MDTIPLHLLPVTVELTRGSDMWLIIMALLAFSLLAIGLGD